MRFTVVLAAGALIALVTLTSRAADEPTVNKVGETPDVKEQPEAEAESASPWSFDFAVQAPTAYVFRGYLDVDDSWIVQPEATVNYTTEIGGMEVSPHVGVWADIVEADIFREIDFIAGVSIALPQKLTLDVVYTFYISPNNDFEDVSEIGAVLSHDDALQPHAALYRELDDSLNWDHPGTYFELGIEPELPVKLLNEKLSFTVPATLGMSFGDYYLEEDGDNYLFGYAAAGLHASYELSEHLELTAGVDYVQMLADSVEEANDGHQYKFVGAVGLSYSL